MELRIGKSEDTNPASLCKATQQYIREGTASGNTEA
jgi:hypothetical protein